MWPFKSNDKANDVDAWVHEFNVQVKLNTDLEKQLVAACRSRDEWKAKAESEARLAAAAEHDMSLLREKLDMLVKDPSRVVLMREVTD